MSSYYYLMAQLPGILPNAPLSITYDTFRETASRFLSSRDKRILDGLSLEPPRESGKTGSPVVDGFFERERAMRLSLERLRAPRLKRDVPASADAEGLIHNAAEAVQIARTAAGFENPLEAERYLDRVRLEYVELLRGIHSFDSDAVFAYGLMLLLHERSDRFTAESGRASYTTIYNKILGE